MKKINAIINSFAFLLLVALMSACNKDGIETIVIEDGQPSVAQMIIGTWNPDRGEIVDEEGNVTEEIPSDDMGSLNFDDGEVETDGGSHTPGGMHEGGSSDWNVNEGNPQKPGVSGGTGGGTGYDGEGPWVNIGGERWYIFQLTDHILIIYRIYDGYIIIYYYYRVGDYNEPEPEPTPGIEVITNRVDVSSDYIFVTGSISVEAEGYFLVSTSSDMSNAKRYHAEFDTKGSDNPADWEYYCGLGELQPETTYYAQLCAMVGENEVRGNIISFTTLDRSQLHLGSVTYTPWGGNRTDFVNETPLGTFLLHGNLQGDIWQDNMMVSYDFTNKVWNMPALDYTEGDAALIAYWPYQQQANPWEFVVYNGTDYMYGTCEGLNSSNREADIYLNHVMAKVNFSITIEEGSSFDGTINRVVIGNNNDPAIYDRYQAIPWAGHVNMTTNTLTPIYNSHDGVWLDCAIRPSADAQVVETFIVPTKFSAGNAYVQLLCGNNNVLSSNFSEDVSWEPGREYTYRLVITNHGLQISKGEITPWENNMQGEIIVGNDNYVE